MPTNPPTDDCECFFFGCPCQLRYKDDADVLIIADSSSSKFSMFTSPKNIFVPVQKKEVVITTCCKKMIFNLPKVFAKRFTISQGAFFWQIPGNKGKGAERFLKGAEKISEES